MKMRVTNGSNQVEKWEGDERKRAREREGKKESEGSRTKWTVTTTIDYWQVVGSWRPPRQYENENDKDQGWVISRLAAVDNDNGNDNDQGWVISRLATVT